MKPAINSKTSYKMLQTYQLNNAHFTNHFVTDEIQGKNEQFIEFKTNVSTTCQNQWDTISTVKRWIFIAVNALVRSNNILMMHLKPCENQEQTNNQS